jgi:hypothetical protein
LFKKIDNVQYLSEYNEIEEKKLFFCLSNCICFLFLGNAALISEALRHYQRLENENNGERIIEKSARKSEKHRRHYHIKECKIRPIIIQQAVTHKIKVSFRT